MDLHCFITRPWWGYSETACSVSTVSWLEPLQAADSIGGRSTRVSSKQSNFFSRFELKLNLFRLFFGLFRETKKPFFRFVSVFRTGIKTTETKRIFSKQTEKISKKSFLLGVLKTVNFFSQFEPKQIETQSVSVVFWFAFLGNQKFVFQFVSVCFTVSDRYRNNRNKQNFWYGELKRLIF